MVGDREYYGCTVLKGFLNEIPLRLAKENQLQQDKLPVKEEQAHEYGLGPYVRCRIPDVTLTHRLDQPVWLLTNGTPTDLSALMAMKALDDEFSCQLRTDDSISDVFLGVVTGNIDTKQVLDQSKNDQLRSHVLTIERGINRVNFAVNLKRHVKRLFAFILPSNGKADLAAQVQEELEYAMQLAYDFDTLVLKTVFQDLSDEEADDLLEGEDMDDKPTAIDMLGIDDIHCSLAINREPPLSPVPSLPEVVPPLFENPQCDLVDFPLAIGYTSCTCGLGMSKLEDDNFLRQLKADKSLLSVFNRFFLANSTPTSNRNWMI